LVVSKKQILVPCNCYIWNIRREIIAANGLCTFPCRTRPMLTIGPLCCVFSFNQGEKDNIFSILWLVGSKNGGFKIVRWLLTAILLLLLLLKYKWCLCRGTGKITIAVAFLFLTASMHTRNGKMFWGNAK